jgi:hypothetical protein
MTAPLPAPSGAICARENRQMFTSSATNIVVHLDGMLGHRRATQQLLALASAAVLTAFPYGHSDVWLKAVREEISRAGPRARAPLGGGMGRQPISLALRDSVLHWLLHSLEQDHSGSREEILDILAGAAVHSLAGSDEEVEQFAEALLAHHSQFLDQWVVEHPDLN